MLGGEENSRDSLVLRFQARTRTSRMEIGVINRNNGKEHGNYCSMLGVYNNGKENGNYYSSIKGYILGSGF